MGEWSMITHALCTLFFWSKLLCQFYSIEAVLDILMAGLESNNLLLVTLSVSALWSLLYNNSKVQPLAIDPHVYMIALF